MRKNKYPFSHLFKTDSREYHRLASAEFRKKHPDYYDKYRKEPKDERKVILENIFDELPSDAIPVDDFPTYYARPNGEVWRDTREIESAIKHGKARVLRLTQTYIPKNGYWIIQPYKDGKRKVVYTHRFILTAFKGPAPDSTMECHHIDHNPSNNAIDNLMWVTRQENADFVPNHKRRVTKVKYGEGRKPSESKYSHLYPEVKQLKQSGVRNSDIAKTLGVNPNSIHQVIHVMKKRGQL